MTAKELLESTDTTCPITKAFNNHLGSKPKTKRQAAEFLRQFGPAYGLCEKPTVLVAKKVVAKAKPIHKPASFDRATAAINAAVKSMIGK